MIDLRQRLCNGAGVNPVLPVLVNQPSIFCRFW